MKVVKLTKKMLDLLPCDLLVSLGAVDIEKNITFPQHVYLSQKDYRRLEENIRKIVKKDSKRFQTFTIGLEMLNFGPNQSLREAIRPNYALVDEEAIKVAIVTNKLNG